MPRLRFNDHDATAVADRYRGAGRLAHVVLDDFVSDPDLLATEFPDPSWSGWTALGDSYQRNKYSCANLEHFPDSIRAVFDELASPRFLAFLEAVTGIKKLIPDPYLEGGGLHLSTGGGILAPHTDFHIYDRLGLFRRLNLILYLNPGWSPGDGGELELSEPGDLTPIHTIEPIAGRAIIFETNDTSVHGFRTPVREGTTRRSLAVYYYTAADTAHFSGDQTTHWRDHGRIRWWSRPRFVAYRGLLLASRGFSIVAQIVNPNQGVKLLRTRLRDKK